MANARTQGEMWNRAPEDWAGYMEPQHKPLWEVMLDEARSGRETRVLDAGCGGGGASVLAAGRGASVSGIDAAKGMIAVASNRVPGGDFRVGDIQELPFDDAFFDAVIASNSLQYAADQVETLREFARVTRPGGRVVVGLFGPPEKVAFSLVFKVIRANLPETPAGAGPFGMSKPGVLRGLFDAAGLEVVGQGEVDCPFIFPDFEHFWRGQNAAGPFQNAVKTVGADVLKTAIREALAPLTRPDGRVVMQPNIFQFVTAAI